MKISNFKLKISLSGFTLIELLWSVAIVAMLSSVGIAAFFTYSRQQALQSAVSDFTTMLQVAKYRAQTQVKVCATGILERYDVVLRQSSNEYELNVVCSSNTQPIQNQEKPFSDGVKFCNIKPNATDTTFSFAVLTGVVSGITSVDISGYGKAKTVSVSPSGVIKVTDSVQVCPL